MLARNPSRRLLHPLCMNSFRHWARVLREHGPIDRCNLDRAAAVTLLSLLTSPLRLAESAIYRPRVRSHVIHEAPIFILGHWRTGTTYLHSLLTQDKRMGYVPLFQTLAPTSFLVGQRTLQPLVALRAPKTRPMDDVHIDMEIAQEEEFALANSSGESFYLGWYFPRSMDSLSRKYALFEGLSSQELAGWERAYLGVLKTASFHCGGKRLVVKNPVNTARIQALLDLFPDAKFVHRYRDPFAVFKSSIHMHRAVLDLVSFQKSDDAEIERRVLQYYRELMMRYLADRSLIPKGNLVEVRYEDLVAQPLSEVARIYDQFRLPGWEDASAVVADYVSSQRTYRLNHFSITQADIEKVQQHWGFALEAWGYAPPQVESRAAGGTSA